MRRGEVVWAKLSPTLGHEQAGVRPVLVVSENRFNARLRLAIVIPVTSKDKWKPPFQIDLGVVDGTDAFALPGQVRTVSTERLGTVLGTVDAQLVDRCLDAVLEICGRRPKRVEVANEGGAVE